MNETDRGVNAVRFAEETLMDSKAYFKNITRLHCKYCFP